MAWKTKPWWQKAAWCTLGWTVLVLGWGGLLTWALNNQLSDTDREEIQTAFLTILVAGLCALWVAYWRGKNIPTR